ncbi:Dps family protein [Microscilla marina]|uniref:DPS family protein n=1 Tax=Microscilla marina ATCC 23134 TaxID=313606 RepID=A1ZLQ0_MICM2|nr:DNA starvation/stationary phase protection protein [Microscilla marina]EAY28804.1 DPS family protein [Microscilla marina ATCC 23134]
MITAELNLIGLDKEQAGKLANDLNQLLANFQIHYQNLRGFHWNIKGKNFFELHAKFEELYTDAQEKIDQIAERILTLGFTPLHVFSDYLERAQIAEGKNVLEDQEAVNMLIQSMQTLITIERQALEYAADLHDEGTVAMLSDFIATQEKTVWMFSAWLNNS